MWSLTGDNYAHIFQIWMDEWYTIGSLRLITDSSDMDLVQAESRINLHMYLYSGSVTNYQNALWYLMVLHKAHQIHVAYSGSQI